MDLFVLLSGVFGLAGVVYLYLTWNFGYWKKRGVPHLPPIPGFGNIAGPAFLTSTFADLHKKIYDAFPGYKYCGYYSFRTPALFLRDPELVKNVFVKDFSNFHDNNFHVDEKLDPLLSKNPFVLTGERWKLVRGQVSPAFTAGKVKSYFPLILEVADRLVNYIKENSIENKKVMFAKDLCARYTVDVVISCALGINAQSFEIDKAQFREMGRRILEGNGYLDGLWFVIGFYCPTLAKILRLKFIPTDLHEFFLHIIKDNLKYRKDNNIVRNDFMEFMIQLRAKSQEYDFNEEHMAGQLLTFFTDGFETSAVTFSYILYELACNPYTQEKLRSEVDEVFEQNNDNITFDVIQGMQYLECVFSEGLRKNPPTLYLQKLCTSPTKFPHPNGNGADVTIEVGTPVVVPVYTLHHDENHYAGPEIFDPERFSDERKHEIPKGAYLPFGDGPRMCLGTRLASAQIKTGLVFIVRNFEITVNRKTEHPLRIDPSTFLLTPMNGIWLDFHKRS